MLTGNDWVLLTNAYQALSSLECHCALSWMGESVSHYEGSVTLLVAPDNK